MKLIQTLLEMAKRASPDGFYKLGKEMYGSQKVKSLTWPEIKAIADKHDVLIPAYLRSQKVGRGRFNIVPADHADAKTEFKPLSKPEAAREVARKEPIKTEPKVEPKSTSSTGEVSETTLRDALYSVRSKMLRHSQSYSMAHGISPTYGNGLEFELRDWGQWVTPSDVEDDEDYDWQELTGKYHKILRDICAEVEKDFPGVKVEYDAGEKNWITVSARPKK